MQRCASQRWIQGGVKGEISLPVRMKLVFLPNFLVDEHKKIVINLENFRISPPTMVLWLDPFLVLVEVWYLICFMVAEQFAKLQQKSK